MSATSLPRPGRRVQRVGRPGGGRAPRAERQPERQGGRRGGIRALLPYLADHRTTLLTVAALSLAGSGAALVQPLLVRAVLDGIGASQPVARLVSLLVGTLLAGALIEGSRNYLLQRTAEGLVLGMRRRLTDHLLRLPIAEFDQRRTGDLLSRVGADTTLLRAVVTSGLFETLTGAVMVVGAATAMIVLDPVLFGVTLAGVATGLLLALAFARRLRGLSEQAQARVGAMTSAVERAISAARTIRASRAERREAAVVAGAAGEAYQAGLRMARTQAMIGPIGTVAVQGAFLLVLGVGGARVAAAAISVGDLVAFIMFLFFLIMPLGQALHAYTQLQTGLGALRRVEELLDLPAEELDEAAAAAPLTAPAGAPVPEAARPAAQTRPVAVPAVEFDQVSFGYPGSGPVLRDVSFTVPPGTRTALVGPSGAGKSTLLALVERFYEVTGGSLRVDGRDIRDLPRAALRAKLGYVEQEAPVLAGTLRDNLLLTLPTASDDQLLAVLDEVNLGGLVERTADGLDAQVGEGGVLLSGGERQRLAIARTLLAGPPILLLDEPTSNLDARNEVALRRAIDTAAAQRTLLIVAHRLSTVIDADQIVVLDRGQVVAVGPHRELTETNPLYRELAAHQLLVG